MTYVGSPFEQLSLGQGLPTVTMQDRWNISLDGWEADIADVVAHLASANAKIDRWLCSRAGGPSGDRDVLRAGRGRSLRAARHYRPRQIQSHRSTSCWPPTVI